MGKTEKNRKENHATKVTRISKTKRRKYEMNETEILIKNTKNLKIMHIVGLYKSKWSNSLLICTWFLKNQVKNSSSTNWIFTAQVACKNQFGNWFLQAKNPICRTWFLQPDSSKIKYKSTGDWRLEFQVHNQM